MKVFLTGASGWVGRHVVPELLGRGHAVTALARSDAAVKHLESRGVQAVRGSLEDLKVLFDASREADAVIHLAYIHDFSDYGGKPAQIDYAAIRSMCSALEGSNKVIVCTSAITSQCQVETDRAFAGPRQEAEKVVFGFNDKGVRTVVVRLSPSVHGDGDHGLISFFIQMARAKGFTGYIGDGANTWSGVHVMDAARLYRMAIENHDLKAGTVLNGAEQHLEGTSFKDIQSIIAKRLDIPLKSFGSQEEAKEYFGGLTYFANFNMKPSTQITRDLTGWEPREIGLLEDLETGEYFSTENTFWKE
ncbi:hypothetical protein I302_107371 [Kwoniella bestiolae CBS 10118]|uniref:NAD-dependent epimerase/dehydratase domain-containing protein n=1 Tax=Kwoniella bestiolae CBS 10118 TaxID=1296100 RepID=A0A1B9FYR7_9TREE|nr:hypothetical protein I302_06891 [Kwoniella bestiolae CBS 10118]OCF23905.1 hypothetical protein I302_06891 [Kwoniella bestiolae CBS 10118]